MIPTDYASWQRCITVDCGLDLTPAFVADRLAELRDPTHRRTRRFVQSWGEAHRLRVVGFFERAERRLGHADAGAAR